MELSGAVGIVPRPVDEVVAKAWGFASENALHGREGRALTVEDAERVVSIAAAAATYIARKLTKP